MTSCLLLAYKVRVQKYQLLLISVAGPATVEDIQQACLVDPSQFYFWNVIDRNIQCCVPGFIMLYLKTFIYPIDIIYWFSCHKFLVQSQIHIGDGPFVPSREVVLFSEGNLLMIKELHQKVFWKYYYNIFAHFVSIGRWQEYYLHKKYKMMQLRHSTIMSLIIRTKLISGIQILH